MGDKMRFTGMSGIDTQSMIDQLMAAESMRKNTIFRSREKLNFLQDAFRSTGLAIKNFQNSFLSFSSTTTVVNMRSASSFGINRSSVTTSSGDDAKGVTIIAPSDVDAGNYSFSIDAVAQSEKRISTKDYNDLSKIKLTNLSDSTLTSEDSIDLNYNGKNYSLNFSGNGTNEDQLRQAISDAGLKGVVVSSDGLSVTAGNDLRLSEGSLIDRPPIIGDVLPDTFAVSGTKRFMTGTNLQNDKFTLKHTYKIALDGGDEKEITIELKDATREEYITALNDELSTQGVSVYASLDNNNNVILTSDSNDTVIKLPGTGAEAKLSEVRSFTADGKTIEFTVTDNMTKQEYVNAISRSLSDNDIKEVTVSIDSDGKLQFKGTGSFTSDFTLDGLTSLGFSNDSSTIERTSSLDIIGGENNSTSSLNLTSLTLSELLGTTSTGASHSISINGNSIDYTDDTTVKEFMDLVNKNGSDVSISFSSTLREFSLSGKNTGDSEKINIVSTSGSSFIDALGLDSSSIVKDAQSAQITYTGDGSSRAITLTREENSFIVDGITINLDNTSTIGENITVSVSKDTEKTKENIMTFIGGYNDMIDKIQGELNTSRPKSDSYTYYDPLLDSEKAAMSDKQIEDWEEQAKVGLLYGDPMLNKFVSSARTISYKTIELSDGTKLSLQDLGITTGNYYDGAKLIVDEKKLDDAISKYGGSLISELFSKEDVGIAEQLNKTVDDAVGTRGYISEKVGFKGTLTEIQNTVSREIKSQDERLADLERMLLDKENYYYQMFAKMDQAIMESNNQMSYLMSF